MSKLEIILSINSLIFELSMWRFLQSRSLSSFTQYRHLYSQLTQIFKYLTKSLFEILQSYYLKISTHLSGQIFCKNLRFNLCIYISFSGLRLLWCQGFWRSLLFWVNKPQIFSIFGEEINYLKCHPFIYFQSETLIWIQSEIGQFQKIFLVFQQVCSYQIEQSFYFLLSLVSQIFTINKPKNKILENSIDDKTSSKHKLDRKQLQFCDQAKLIKKKHIFKKLFYIDQESIQYIIIGQQVMQQQLIEQTIQITPQTMKEVIPKLTQALGQTNLTHSQNEQILQNIVKSIFYGLWNFDKMINQHNLSTNIAEMLSKLPKKNAFAFFQSILSFLASKWNLIDHHRINKFMQLTRYLIKQALKISQKKTNEVLMQTVFKNISQRSGIADHVIQLYFDTICEVTLTKKQNSPKYHQLLPFQKLQIFQNIIKMAESLQYIRIHIIEKVYEKYKEHIIEHYEEQPEKIIQKIQIFSNHLIQLSKNQQNDSNRKNLYTLVGFMRSDYSLFNLYMIEKRQKINLEREKKTKKISKGKKQMIKQAKQKKKQSKKDKKKNKIISRPTFQFKAMQLSNKPLE